LHHPFHDAAPLAVEGVNCWRRPQARRAAMLVDGDACFSAFVQAMRVARRSIYIAGWDIHSRARLVREEDAGGLPVELGRMLSALTARRRGLRVHVLSWDYAMIYALEREPLPLLNMGWRTHGRVRFHLDGMHPLGACHHQKLLIVDDAVAFCGGLDLTVSRWDTPLHLAHDPLRTLPSGSTYGPFHDVQMIVDGPAASALADIFRRRWRRATGRRLPRLPARGSDPWPAEVRPEFLDVRVAIARTQPAHAGHREVREVEQLYLDGIRAARRELYIENQYVTSTVMMEALARRLEEPDGPQVVIVSPLRLSGWLEENTMGTLRGRLLRRLHAADRHGRLRFVHPVVPGCEDPGVNVHSKVMVVDDRALRVGSANLSNRSMGLDTECDLMLEAEGDPRRAEAILGARNRLLGEHLGRPAEEIHQAVREGVPLNRLVDAFAGAPRALRPIPVPPDTVWLEEVLPERLVDPERPIDPEELIEQVVPEQTEPRRRLPAVMTAGAIVLLALALFGAATEWTFLGAMLDPRVWLDGAVGRVPVAAIPAVVIAGYLLAGLLVLPVTLVIVETGVLFGPWWGFGLAWSGAMTSAIVFYGLGRLVGHQHVRRLPGCWLDRLGRWIARRGVMAVVVARVLPLAPFTIVNLVAGASRVPFRDYVLGTMISMTPGIALMTAVGNQLGHTLRDGGALNILLLVAIAAATAAAGWTVQKRLNARDGKPSEIREEATAPRAAARR
jgi:phospholipase D1/2